jgi:iron complex outermembrane receptor protein
VYSSIFSGVRWEIQDLLLEDLERVEVIRGPGAALWGANAVNGVVNFITKDAADTQGGLLSAGGGSEEKGFGAIRYGMPIKENSHGRLYMKYSNRDGFADGSGDDMDDGWDVFHGGFRLDSRFFENSHMTLQGDVVQGNGTHNVTSAKPFTPVMKPENGHFSFDNANLLMRWTTSPSEDSEFSIQAYYDYYSRDTDFIRTKLHTFDLEAQHRLKLSERQIFQWGLGYRLTSDDIQGRYTISFTPDHRTDQIFSAYVQDTFTLVEDKFRLILGSKFEHNDYTGFEIQPNIRMVWTPEERHSLWASLSRAVQVPSRSYTDIRLNIVRFPYGLMSIFGSKDNQSEEVLAYELGYRIRAARNLMFDFAVFYNDYENPPSIEMQPIRLEMEPGFTHVLFPMLYDNKLNAKVYGIEVAADWQVTERWRLASSFSSLEMDLDLDSSSSDARSLSKAGRSPQYQAAVRSYLNLPKHVEFDTTLYYVDELTALDVPGYVRLDLRLGWRPFENLELNLVAQNVLEGHHPEYGGSISEINPTEPQRTVFGKVTWRF